MNRPLVVALLLVAVPAHAGKAPKPPRPWGPKVAVSFDWQPGWAGTSTTVFTEKIEVTGKPAFDKTTTVTATVGIDAAGEDLVLRQAVTGVEGPQATVGNKPAVAPDPSGGLLAALERVGQEVRIGRTGDFIGWADAAAMDAAVRAAVDGAVVAREAELGDDEEALAAFRERVKPIQGVLTAELLELQLARDWHGDVLSWRDGQFDVGQGFRFDDMRIHHPSGAVVPARVKFSAARWEACHDGKKAPPCILLHVEENPDPAQILAATTAALPDLLPEALRVDGFEATGVSLARRTTVRWVEPTTMRCWREIIKDELTVDGKAGVKVVRVWKKDEKIAWTQ